jgi:Glycosyl transferase family 2
MRISVVLCTLNGGAHLPRQLRSLAQQQRRPDELVAFDDGSNDSTAEILRRFAEAAPFAVRWQVNPRRLGVVGNFQSAIAAAAGDVIACCDQDDIWYPDKLACMEAAMADGAADLVCSDADLVDQSLRPLGRRLWESIGFGQRPQAEVAAGRLWSVLFRFNVVSGAGMAFGAGWRDLLLPIPRGWTHDAWIGMALAMVGRCRLLPEPLWAYRCHRGQQIGPGPARLSQRLAAAAAMDRAYFQRLEQNFIALAERLEQRPIDPAAARRLRAKITHCRARAALRTAGAWRPRWIAAELLSGRYRSCALGWQSLAQDVCLTGKRRLCNPPPPR